MRRRRVQGKAHVGGYTTSKQSEVRPRRWAGHIIIKEYYHIMSSDLKNMTGSPPRRPSEQSTLT